MVELRLIPKEKGIGMPIYIIPKGTPQRVTTMVGAGWSGIPTFNLLKNNGSRSIGDGVANDHTQVYVDTCGQGWAVPFLPTVPVMGQLYGQGGR